jgi:hypothetical protein
LRNRDKKDLIFSGYLVKSDLIKEKVMNRYRVLVQADRLKTIIPIPREFEHKEVEVTITLPRKSTFNPREFKSIFHVSKENIDSDLKGLRQEWDRHGK